jgi:Protein of unknown function (DUF2975)
MATQRIEAPTTPARFLNTALSATCVLLIVTLPAVTLFIVVFSFEVFTDGLGLSPAQSAAPITFIQRGAIAAVALLPVALIVYALTCAWRCFRSFARGEYLSLAVVRNLRRFAAGIFFSTVAALLTTPVLTYLVTLGAGPDGHTVSVNFSSTQALTLLFAGIVWQVAAVMTRAVAVAEENSQFV